MLTYEEILKNCSNYKIENGIVIDKSSNQPVTDEDVILKVKSSILLFKEAKEEYQSDLQQFGKINKSQEDCIRKTMEKFSVNNEQNTFGINKLVNAILNSNGHYEEYISGKDLQNNKFSILVAPKSDYGISYLKMKFREKGLDIEDLKISQDLTEFQRNGISKVIIDFKIKKYEKTTQNTNNLPGQYRHPMAHQLNELEKQKKIAKQNNDQVAYQNAQNNIEKIIRSNPATVTPQQWDSMSIDEQIYFVQVKVNESIVLHSEDDYKYWNANLQSLKNKKNEQSKVQEYNFVSYNSAPPNQSDKNIPEEKKDYKYYFEEMMKSVVKYSPEKSYSEEEKKQIMGEIFYNELYMIDSLSKDEDIGQLLTMVINNLDNNEMQIRLSKIIAAEMQEKYKQLHPDLENKDSKQEKRNNPNNLDLSVLITELKSKLNQVQNAYHSMLSDGHVNEEELSTLIRMIKPIIDDGYSLKVIATDKDDIRVIASIIDTLEYEHKKMKKMQNNLDEIGRRGR